MKNSRFVPTWTTILMSLFLFALAGCSSGGGTSGTIPAPTPTGTTLSGTAAAGAPVVGSVTIKDSSSPTKKEKTVAIAADGKYTVDVSDMTAPFAMRADGYVGGREYHLYSAATQADLGGTVNITPFTDLIIANIAGDIAANYFNNGTYSTLAKADMDAAQTALKAKLQPILTAVGLADSIDLMRTAFSADHKGLDGVLDVIKVTVDPSTKVAEITNIINNVKINDDLQSKADTGAFTSADGAAAATGLTDVQAIAKGFDDFSALFATSLPATTNAQLLAMFDQTGFMFDGMTLASFLGEITSDPTTIGLKFANVSVIALDPTAGTGEVAFDVVIQGRTQVEGPENFKMVKKNNVWLMQGNQRIAQAQIEVQSNLSINSGSTTPQIQTGLFLNIQDRGGKGISKAVVKGPGLPAAGVTLINDIASNRFGITNPGDGFVSMDEATVSSIPETGASFSIELMNAANAVLATYTNTIKKRPFKPSELTTASFPAITAPSLADLRAFNGGSLIVTWSIPAGLQADFTAIFLSGAGGSAEAEKMLSPTATTTTLTVQPQAPDGTTFTIINRSLTLGAIDSFGRGLKTNIN